MQQSVTIVLSAFAGGYAGNLLSNNPGFFEQIGATIALLILLIPTIHFTKMVAGSADNNKNEEVGVGIVSIETQDGEVIHGNGEIVKTEFVEASVNNPNVSYISDERVME